MSGLGRWRTSCHVWSICNPSTKFQARLKEKSGLSSRLTPIRRLSLGLHWCSPTDPHLMEDKFKRIAVVALDIGIIALMLVSLVWNAPAFKMREDPDPALAKTFDDRWAE